jgi:hypothetical protein
MSWSHLLPPLPGLTALARTYAPWPVWSGSTTKPVQFAAMPKKAAVRLWHRARYFDRSTVLSELAPEAAQQAII